MRSPLPGSIPGLVAGPCVMNARRMALRQLLAHRVGQAAGQQRCAVLLRELPAVTGVQCTVAAPAGLARAADGSTNSIVVRTAIILGSLLAGSDCVTPRI